MKIILPWSAWLDTLSLPAAEDNKTKKKEGYEIGRLNIKLQLLLHYFLVIYFFNGMTINYHSSVFHYHKVEKINFF